MGYRIAAKVDSFSSSVLKGLEWKEIREGIISFQMSHNKGLSVGSLHNLFFLYSLVFKFILAL